MIDWRNVSLLGIDVGFSQKAKSTGIAVYDRGHLTLTCIGSLPQSRADVLPRGLTFDAIAIDGPIVTDADRPAARRCEVMLSRGKFSRRCKPGLSHFGFGLQLRQAATQIANEMQSRAKPARADFTGRQARSGTAIVEAFPNAFLGVLLSDADYAELGHIKRGAKSDVFYRRAAANKTFDAILDLLGWNDGALRSTLCDHAAATARAAHDKRAALICMLTAACALSGQAEYVGDDAGGWICLPPQALWADWARTELTRRPDAM